MTEYRLLTTWQFEAPLEAVYGAVCDPLRWPEWWPDVRRVEQRQPGNDRGEGQWLHCVWQGRLPYRFHFDILTTRIRPLVLVEGTVEGDLEGIARCEFSHEQPITTVRHEWRVRTTRPWMNLLAPWVSPLLKYNHAQAMRRAGERLARRLGAPPPALRHEDLGGATDKHIADQLAAAGAGLIAGGLATALQAALWWAAGLPVAETFERDVRLTAAIVLGSGALAAPAGTGTLLLAALIHLLLSAAYGLALAPLLARLATARALAAGALFGAALYGINLYGFTALFPWFAVARDGITFATHVAFGLLLAGGWLTLRRGPP